MPKVSVIIPAYKVDAYLERCLDSLRCQTFEDFEAIVVDDASPDDVGKIADAYAARDERFRVVHHERNLGLHRARCSGVEAMTGDYVVFLDGDDELAPTMLEQAVDALDLSGADILHVGMTFIAEAGVSEELRCAMEGYANRPSRRMSGEDVIREIFDERCGQFIDWRVTQRVWRAEVIRKGFAAMSRASLMRAEDGYECFVLASLARSSEPAEDQRGYLYHFGLGITGASSITAERFGVFCQQFRACLDAAAEYVESQGSTPALVASYEGMRHKMVELLANDLRDRVARDSWSEAFGYLTDVFGGAVAGREAWRLTRDAAYVFVSLGKLPAEDDVLYDFLDAARGIDVDDAERSDDAERFRSMRRIGLDHMASIERGLSFRAHCDERIRIFVTTHKHVDVPKSGILQLVQVGPGLKHHRFLDAFHDDEGETITELNDRYCELTTQYWAWKNIDADYVGFCHYRRYFNFSDETYPENPFGEVMDDFIDAEAVERYGLDDETMRRCIEGYDVITTGFHDIRDFPGDFSTIWEHWADAPQLHDDDLELMASIVKVRHPDYIPDVDGFLDGSQSCFCNMYLMRQSIFHAYCAWLFPLLEEFCACRDMARYGREARRTPGHLAERLFNIYYLHALRVGTPWRTKQLQCVHFEYPDRAYLTVRPVFDYRADLQPSSMVPIVLAADDDYVPMLATTLLSLAEHASPDRYYDIVIFERNISQRRKDGLVAMLSSFENVALRFHNVWRQVAEYRLSTTTEHISVETYYRFLIQEVLVGYDKVLYLDADLVVLGDVAELFDTDVEGRLLAAAGDIDFVGNACGADRGRMAYARETMGLVDPYAYFQAGVLVMNTAELRKLHSVREWLEISSKRLYLYDDQDILNAECQGRVVALDPAWNVTHDCGARVGRIYSFAPVPMYDAYLDAREHPAIIHYAGFEKPWTYPRCDFAHVYWEYARRTPYYEEFMEILATAAATRVDEAREERRAREAEEARIAALPPKAVSEDSSLRGIIDPIAPLGTRRREALKSVGRMVNKMRGHGTGPDGSGA